VAYPSGAPYTAGSVRAIAKRVRRETPLGESLLDRDGRFAIRYLPDQASAERVSFDLLVRVVDEQNRPLADAAVRFDAQPDETVDVQVSADAGEPTEFDRLADRLRAALDGLDPAEITTADLDYLAGATGEHPDQITAMAAAARLSRQTGVDEAVLYGLIRQHPAGTLTTLLAQSPEDRQRTLEAAVDGHLVPYSVLINPDRVTDRLHAAIITALTGPDGPGGPSGLGALLATTLPDVDLQAAFLRRGLAHSGSPEQLWQELRGDPQLGDVADDLQFSVQVGLLTQGHLPLVEVLQEQHRQGALGSIRDLAGLNQADWLGLIEANRTGVPPGIPGEDQSGKAGAYAAALSRLLEDAFPTAALAQRLHRHPDSSLYSQELLSFLDDNPDFDLATDRIDRYFDQHTGLDSAADTAGLVGQLKTLQRLFKCSPRFSDIDVLHAAGYESATSIARAGKASFLQRHADQLGGVVDASRIFERAAAASTLALSVFTRHRAEFSAVTPRVISEQPTEVDGIPDWRTLFPGSLAMCDCEQCRSVFSPAAYLVDLLAFLDRRNSTIDLPGSTPPRKQTLLELLLGRRPDLDQLKLSCENSHTPVPYVDLVNELLELAILEGSDPPRQGQRQTQTVGTAAELAAAPQHLNAEVYEVDLAQAVYPWTLPFHLPTAEARTYLDHLGVPRAELMAALSLDPLDDHDIAAERLGLTSTEWKIITGADLTPPRQEQDYWGFPDVAPEAWPFVLDDMPVVEFLKRTGLRFEELLELVDSPWGFGSPLQLGLSIVGLEDRCDPEGLFIVLSTNRYDLFRRFVRLWRSLDWSLHDLERIVLQHFASHGTGELTTELLKELAAIEQLRQTLSVPVLTAATWLFSTMSTHQYLQGPEAGGKLLEAAHYDQVFLPPTLEDTERAAFALNARRDELEDTSHTLAEHATGIVGALGISANDLVALVADAFRQDDGPPATLASVQLNLEHLTLLYKHVTLQRAMDLSIADYLSLRRLGPMPFGPVGDELRAVLDMVDMAARCAASGFTVAELQWLVQDTHRPGEISFLPEKQLASTLEELRGRLLKIHTEQQVMPDPLGELTKSKLALLMEGWVVAESIAMLNDATEYSAALATLPDVIVPTDLQARVVYDRQAATVYLDGMPRLNWQAASGELRCAGPLSNSARSIFARLSTVQSYQDALAALFDAPRAFVRANFSFAQPDPNSPTHPGVAALLDTDISPTDRFAWVLERLVPHLRTVLSEELVIEMVAAATRLDASVTARMVRGWLHSPSNPNDSMLSAFLALAEITGPLDRSIATTQFHALTRLVKISRLVTHLRLGMDELEVMFELPFPGTWLNLDLLPVDYQPDGGGGLAELLDYVQFRDGLLSSEPALIDIIATARHYFIDGPPDLDPAVARATALRQISVLTGWQLSDLETLSDRFQMVYPESFMDEWGLVRLQRVFGLLRRIGLPASQVTDWTTPTLSTAHATQVRQATQAGQDPRQWLQVARTLRDPLREQQRAALVAFVLANPQRVGKTSLNAPSELYAHLLVDVEMSPCMNSSRIVQATNAVQLFMQRSLLDLELGVQLTSADRRDWEWLRQYRVWEANRRIFYYPESVIEPELRAGKSALFQALESQLSQTDLTAQTVEPVFLRYLEGLDEVGRLEIAGMYHQLETDQNSQPVTDILHVVARTRSAPHRHYYRTLVRGELWTPWDKIDVDIEGDHLLPVIHNRRLYLFFPQFHTAADETVPAEGKGSKPERHIEVSLGWIELRQGHWSAKRISKDRISLPNNLDNAVPLSFRASSFSSGQLQVDLWENFKPHSYFHRGRFVFYETDGTLLIVGGPPPPSPDDIHTMSAWTIHQAFREFGIENLDLMYCDPVSGERSNRLVLQRGRDDTRLFTIVIPLAGHRVQNWLFCADTSRTFFVQGHGVNVENPSRLLNGERARLDLTPGLLRRHLQPSVSHPLPRPKPQEEPVAELAYPVFEADPSQQGQANTTGLAKSILDLLPAEPAEATGVGSRAVSTLEVNGGSDLLANHIFAEMAAQQVDIRFSFEPFYHPFAKLFIRALHGGGIDSLLQRELQIHPETFRISDDEQLNFGQQYLPIPDAIEGQPHEEIDFSHGGPYSIYNWELFFHAPLLIADRLSRNQRFAEAQRWFHYIFDPTDRSANPVPQRYWRTRPLFEREAGRPIQELLRLIGADQAAQLTQKERLELRRQVRDWRAQPFDPHVLARSRLTAYQMAVVMKYLDNLIRWGDDQFQRGTMESVNEAAQLYLLAAEILGRRPERAPTRQGAQLKSFSQLRQDVGAFAAAILELENLLPTLDAEPISPDGSTVTAASALSPTLYFCVPPNDKLLAYWDTVADRLFKIRHCMNLEGAARELALFAPPIPPGLLAQAATLGLSLDRVLSAPPAAAPSTYRFETLLRQALELCGEVKTLGGALLSALEKRDAEQLALLRSGQEVELLAAARRARQLQVEEAAQGLEAIQRTRQVTQARQRYYASRPYLNPREQQHLDHLQTAATLQTIAQGIDVLGGYLALIPQLDLGVSGWAASPVAKQEFGGNQLAQVTQVYSRVMSMLAAIETHRGTMASILGGYDRRADDWRFQADQAAKELHQLDAQLAGAEIRKAIAEHELGQHDRQLVNARTLDEFMRSKFTNLELYDWLVAQLSTVYFQGYQLAFETAAKAERAFRYELGDLQPDAARQFIRFGYWDSLKKGLLAGERLSHDLRRLQLAYLERNTHEYEKTTHLSLLATDPAALIKLKTTGECFIDLPEALYDLELPGTYLRRLRSVRLSIPCVVGPYTSVNCTLTLLSNSVRVGASVAEGYVRTGSDDPRFVDNVMSVQSGVTSTATNDGLQFEPAQHNDRYGLFEGAGAISRWRVQLPPDCNHFDFDTIADLILHIQWTARDGGPNMARVARDEVVTPRGRTGMRLLSARRDFSAQWYRFTQPEGTAPRTLELSLDEKLFPFQARGRTIRISRLQVLLAPADHAELPSGLQLSLQPPGESPQLLDFHPNPLLGNLLQADQHFDNPKPAKENEAAVWTLSGPAAPIAKLQDLLLLCHFVAPE
jgi:hypothetical protein